MEAEIFDGGNGKQILIRNPEYKLFRYLMAIEFKLNGIGGSGPNLAARIGYFISDASKMLIVNLDNIFYDNEKIDFSR